MARRENDMKHSMIENILFAADGNTCPEFEEICNQEDTRTKAATAAMEKYLGIDDGSYTPTPEKLKLVEMLLELETAYGDRGFKNGFRVAARLMAECLR